MYRSKTIAALKENNEIAFGELFDEYHQKLYCYIFAKTKSAYLAEEVTQLAFIKLWDYRQHLDESLPPSVQIFRIAKTTCIDLLRKEANKSKLATELQQQTATPGAESHPVELKERERILAYAIQKMPPMRKKIFELRRYESMSYKEISRLLSLSEKTVENHIALALRQLRRIFLLLLFLPFF